VDRGVVEEAWQFLLNSREPMNRYSRVDSTEALETTQLPLKDIRDTMTVFFPRISIDETRWVFNTDVADRNHLSLEQFEQLVQDTACSHDPISEAFELVQADGLLSMDKVQALLKGLGVPNLSDDVMKRIWTRLLEDAGASSKERGRGEISLEFFKSLLLCGTGGNSEDMAPVVVQTGR